MNESLVLWSIVLPTGHYLTKNEPWCHLVVERTHVVVR